MLVLVAIFSVFLLACCVLARVIDPALWFVLLEEESYEKSIVNGDANN